MSLQLLCFLAATLFLECFLFHASNGHSIHSFFHILRIESLFLASSLGSSFFLFRARSRVTGRSRACLFLFRFFSFFISELAFFLPLSRFSLSRKVGDGIRSLALRENAQKKKSRASSPKTTASWLTQNSSSLEVSITNF